MSKPMDPNFNDYFDWPADDFWDFSLDACFDSMPAEAEAGWGLDSPAIEGELIPMRNPEGQVISTQEVHTGESRDSEPDDIDIPSIVSHAVNTSSGVSSFTDLETLDYVLCNECGTKIKCDYSWRACFGHAGFKCISCHKCFRNCYEIIDHAKRNRHPALRCNVVGCTQTFVSVEERVAHHKLPHSTNEHGRVAMVTPFDCAECLQSCNSKADLLRHSKECQHQPYRCQCGQAFSRLDVLNRHIKSFDTSIPKFPCMFCRLHRGENGFRRADHLRQHERNYHRHQIETGAIDQEETRPPLKYVFPVCPHAECPKYRNPEFHQLSHSIKEASKPFAKLSEYTQHMRDEHNECPYPCDVAGCNRAGRRGYFREKDLMKHRKGQHPDADSYKVSDQVFMHTCTEPGCGKTLALSSVGFHYQTHAWKAHQDLKRRLIQHESDTNQ